MVIRPVGSPGRALNLVTGWDASLISIILMAPTALSIIISVGWPMIAVLKYGADVQTSVQTAISVASFIVTAAALLIGLVTLFDALSK